MTTELQRAHVFSYPGADASRMLKKLQSSELFQSLTKKKTVYRVFLLTGSNNVDSLAFMKTQLDPDRASQETCDDISNLVGYLQSKFPQATINLLNILPRNNSRRMKVIEKLNNHIKFITEHSASNQLNYIDTYSNKFFTDNNGKRRDDFFKKVHNNDHDNVHLNMKGVARLGVHLKYLAHNVF